MKALAIAGIMLGLWLYIGHVERSARASQKAADAAVVREATLRAEHADKLNTARLRAAYAQGKAVADATYAPQLASARHNLAAYAARMRSQAAQGGGGIAGLPTTAEAARLADGPDSDTVFPVALADLDACAVNTVRLVNVQQWYASITASHD
ncbi:hypothetical protein [Devosia sp.]|uniref:hypothetical protein n=1 Tax=Devosia sp. TaxID=1871048 RepID=UPI002FC8E403